MVTGRKGDEAIANVWLRGKTRSGKTAALIDRIPSITPYQGTKYGKVPLIKGDLGGSQQTILVLAADNRHQRQLADLVTAKIAGRYAFVSKTPLGFMADEVELFLPLICEKLGIKPKFPLRLRPEMEQKFARELWAETFAAWDLNLNERFQARLVRRMLDLLQLAGAAGVAPEEIPQRLIQGNLSLLSGEGIYAQDDRLLDFTQISGDLLLQWRDWCLARGFLTYGIIDELYWRYLLKSEVYQAHLAKKYCAVFADDVNDYPAIAKDLFDVLLDHNIKGVFTENPDGKIRLGLNADPDYLAQLSTRCEVIELLPRAGLAMTLGEKIQTWLEKPSLSGTLPEQIQSIQTISRAQLLDQAIAQIKFLVQEKGVLPEDIAIIAPGLDEVARYTIIETLAQADIPVEPLNEQRPIYSSPWGRSLLTLLCLVYPELGRLIKTSEVAEMLIMLSFTGIREQVSGIRYQVSGSGEVVMPMIDPVRAGLIVDYCFQPDPVQPKLLPAKIMVRGDRLGYRVTEAYEEIRDWFDKAQGNSEITPLAILKTLNQALQDFYLKKLQPRYDQLATLRELTETAQHFWECDRRLRENEPNSPTILQKLSELIQLIQQEAIAANPRPLSTFNRQPNQNITLATIFQYRTARLHHKYQFWLDAGSRLWEKGGATTLFGYGVFQKAWNSEPWSMATDTQNDQQRLQQIVQDLLGRTNTQIYLCHSDFGINGAEQLGPLYTLIQSTQEIDT